MHELLLVDLSIVIIINAIHHRQLMVVGLVVVQGRYIGYGLEEYF